MGFIAEAKRKNLWFGTEEKMEWFKTPSRGADTSPAGWDSEGTTLNGGGYVFNSFGSHKQYQFDWGSSNARVVAQKMKSYADGSYGRGYIYFVDPTIYDHNVLPAHWADPSMGIDYEGNSIVAGVDPVGVPTGSNSNDLPVQAAQFNLNTVPVGFRGKAQAVYVPIPEGHTLSLGAMYSFTGSGGVFASPVLLTGAIAAPQKLTTLGVNTPNIVADTFSGVRGVWLWVGKTAAGNSSVTIHGLIGRLMTNAEATSYVIAENLFTNPRLVGDGTWAEVRRNLVTNPSFEAGVAGWGFANGSGSVQDRTTVRSHSGTYSLEHSYGTAATTDTGPSFAFPVTAGVTYRLSAYVFSLDTSATGGYRMSAFGSTLAATVRGSVSTTADQWTRVEVSITPTSSGSASLFIGKGVSSDTAGVKIWVDSVQVEANILGGYFDGSTMDSTMPQPEDFRVRWLGTENASESVMEIERVRGFFVNNCFAGVSSRHGKPAMRLIPDRASTNASRASIAIPSVAQSGGTIVGTRHLDSPITGAISINWSGLRASMPAFESIASNVPGAAEMRLAYGALTSEFRAWWGHGGAQGSGDVWWTDIGLFAGSYDGPAFSGSSPQNGTTHYRWTGAIDNSTSEAYYVSAKATQQKQGPWVGGMGHAGCRFVGKPTFIENGPDWTGFSATFKEVVN